MYDLGANMGANIPYYRSRGFSVVAVEANPALCEQLLSQYASDRGVYIVNACISHQDADSCIFYVHRENSLLSTFLPPNDGVDAFESVEVPSVSMKTLFGRYGNPFFVKIDIEGADQIALKSIFDSGILPKYLSAEAHSVEVPAAMIAAGYNQFKVIEGAYVDFSLIGFPKDSAGPFGEDVPGDWLTSRQLFDYLFRFGLGWKDIHARRM